MPQVRFICSECHTPLEADVAQSDEDGLASWKVSYFCDECGHVCSGEEGGDGFPPAELRARLIRAEGSFVLVIESDDCGQLTFGAVVAEVFGLRPAAAKSFVEEVPGFAFRGTREECEVLERSLTRDGIVVRVERA